MPTIRWATQETGSSKKRTYSLPLRSLLSVWEMDKLIGTPTRGQVRFQERKKPEAFWEPRLEEIHL